MVEYNGRFGQGYQPRSSDPLFSFSNPLPPLDWDASAHYQKGDKVLIDGKEVEIEKAGVNHRPLPDLAIRPPTVEYVGETPEEKEERRKKMNDIVRGALKSKTTWANGGGILAMIYLWNDPIFMALPKEAKLIIMGILGINLILRFMTDKSISDKGKKKSPLDILKEQFENPEAQVLLDRLIDQRLESMIPKDKLDLIREGDGGFPHVDLKKITEAMQILLHRTEPNPLKSSDPLDHLGITKLKPTTDETAGPALSPAQIYLILDSISPEELKKIKTILEEVESRLPKEDIEIES